VRRSAISPELSSYIRTESHVNEQQRRPRACAASRCRDFSRPRAIRRLSSEFGNPESHLALPPASLEEADFLQRNENGYRIGLAAFEVGTALPIAASLREAAAPVLTELAVDTGEACHLGALVGSEVVYLDRRDTGEGLRFASRIGQRLPAHATGLGKAMLALLDDDEIARRCPSTLPAMTTRTVSTRSALLKTIAEVRRRGYALESEESTPGVCCIGMAAIGPEGPVGVSISVPVQRASIKTLPTFAPALRKAVDRIASTSTAHTWFQSGTPTASWPAAVST